MDGRKEHVRTACMQMSVGGQMFFARGQILKRSPFSNELPLTKQMSYPSNKLPLASTKTKFASLTQSIWSSPLTDGQTDDHLIHGVNFTALPAGIAVSGPTHVICGRIGCNPFLGIHFMSPASAAL